ncbi:hypothetical protein CP985_11805 [Malaciobacter mytili LMG 24559]|uniref:Uncharacterized protein n=1 Tax=Malaciobacter mytili LMG 24559 TaxID=1032238 RepID=A0AAX2ACR2_9BACT|nr:hypothetical protein [Malaciobacter mytili]AXH16352.1 hypothetical protein AMYT_a0052 [Malaciobacter mytili LMG 24559]RXK14797.1 hypothetical protein CP985_11805 [Malaciobacter mytili LMG 24559]
MLNNLIGVNNDIYKKTFSENQIIRTGVSHQFVTSINGIKAEELAKQIAFREHKKVSQIKKITVCYAGNVTYNDNLSVGCIEEYFATLEDYKKNLQ